MAKSPLMKLLKRAFRQNARSEANLSRRRFLQNSAIISSQLWMPMSWGKNPTEKVGIIGAGAAGLACAYALNKNGIPFHIFEGSQRVGGRILTSENWNTDRQFIEIGGELLDSSHTVTFELVKALTQDELTATRQGKKFESSELEILRFSDYEKNGLEKILIYVDRQTYFEKDLVKGIQPLIKKTQEIHKKIFKNQNIGLTFSNQSKFPDAVKMDHKSIRELFADFNGLTESWILKTVLSAYESEFGREADKQSALNFISLMDQSLADGFSMFGDSDEALRLKKGNSSLIRALMNSLTNYGSKSTDSLLSVGSALTSVSRQGSRFLCKFKGRPDQTFSHLVITLPIPILRTIEGLENLDLSREKKLMIKNSGVASNSKAILDFKAKFWRNSGKISNQGEHFIHLDSQVFWETSRMQNGQSGILTNFIGGLDADRADANRASKSLDLLVQIYGDSARKVHSNKSIFMDWQKNPWSQGSYAVLNPGQYSQFWGTGPIAECNGQLLFAGEHTSMDFQGFMNGAYESGLRAARQILKKTS